MPQKFIQYRMTYQFLIRLEGFTHPEVWRRIEAPANYSFFKLHKAITIAFGKPFENEKYSFRPSLESTRKSIFSEKMPFANYLYVKTSLLSSVFKRLEQQFFYLPDCNRRWVHSIVLEAMIKKESPCCVCLAGEGVYPPETCSGPEDYDKMRLALSDRNDPQHTFTREWLELAEDETWESKYTLDIPKVNEQLSHIDSELASFRNYTIVSRNTFDPMYGLTPALWKILDKKRSEIDQTDNMQREINGLKKLVNEYPAIPHFKNALASAYLRNGEEENFHEIIASIIPAFPDYITARFSLALKYIEEELPEEATELLGNNFDLNELFPNRNGRFTEDEVNAFHTAVIEYLLNIENAQEARKHFVYLENLLPFADNINDLRSDVAVLNYESLRKIVKKERLVKTIAETVERTSNTPDFENREIRNLYVDRNRIEKEDIRRLMQLPEESLVRDLEKVLIDSIARFKYFSGIAKNHVSDAPFHALSILSTLQAGEALETFLMVMRQDETYYKFWFEDVLADSFRMFIYNLGQNRLDRLHEFMKEPHRDETVRMAVSDVLLQIAYHQPERNEEVVNWFADTLQYMLEHQNDNGILYYDVYTSLFDNLLHVAGKEHFPVVFPLYDERFYTNFETYTFYKIKKFLAEPKQNIYSREIFTTFDDYYDMWQKWYRPSKGGNNKSIEETTFVSSNKIGRNDPCYCGSGKKYKKCCGVNS